MTARACRSKFRSELSLDGLLEMLPGTTHMPMTPRSEALLAFVEPFLDSRP